MLSAPQAQPPDHQHAQPGQRRDQGRQGQDGERDPAGQREGFLARGRDDEDRLDRDRMQPRGAGGGGQDAAARRQAAELSSVMIGVSPTASGRSSSPLRAITG
jgi:hypothetical protein